MGFVKTRDELKATARSKGGVYEFYDAEMLVVMWETRPEIIKRLLPPPLVPADRPLATAFVAHYPKTNFGPSYYESALFARAQFGGVPGNYCLAMPVTNDMAMAGGREEFGYPKKMADVRFRRTAHSVRGRVERHGVRFFEVRARLTGKTNTEEFQNIILAEASEEGTVAYNFKHFWAPDGTLFDYKPRLVRERTVLRPTVLEWAEAEVFLTHSEHDPWAEVEVVRMLGGLYAVGNNTMLRGEVVAEVDPAAFEPYAGLKWDAWGEGGSKPRGKS
jgi:acetoacetate decarboxylase